MSVVNSSLPKILLLLLCLTFSACLRPPASATARRGSPPEPVIYNDANRSIEDRVHDLVGRLTLEEKASLLIDKAPAIDRLGIPEYDAWNEALHGVAWRDGVTVFPQAIGLASTWDPELMQQVATAISTEARALYNAGNFGLTLWSPVINIARDPRWGRTQEAYGEDPFLESRLAVAYVKGIQGQDPVYLRAVATPKHYALNNTEATRFSSSSDAPEEVLRDYYLPPFRAAVVEGGAQSIMCAYNRVNGTPACADPWLLDTVLRKEWGFNGFVVSDCGAITAMVWGHHVKPTDAAAVVSGLRAGCDLNCGKAYAEQIAEAVRRGSLAEADVDRALGRVLTARFRLGMFDPPEKNPYASIPMSVVDSAEHRALALEAARESLVLLKNDGLLPLDPQQTKKLAVIGPAANVFLHGSAGYHGSNNHLITPRAGIERRAGKAISVSFAAGTVLPSGAGFPMSAVPESMLQTPDGKPGLRGEYFANRDLSGTAALTRIDAQLDFAWGNGSPGATLPSDDFSVRWTGKLTPKRSGNYVLSLTGDDGYRLSLDGKSILEDWTDHAPRTRGVVTPLEAGRAYDVSIEFYEHGGGAELRFNHAFFEGGAADAIQAAREADAVVFVAGVDESAADEEKDFPSLSLPDDQSKLFEAVRKANPRTVLVLSTGNPLVLTPGERSARAIVQAWYAGQDTGTALAEVLFGDTNPSGKLPITFYASLADLPPMDDYDVRKGRTYMYLEKTPAFPFGHGLSYTSFKYENLALAPTRAKPDGTLRIEFDLVNTGERTGAEVAQVYVRPPSGPKQVLRAFRRVALEPGRESHISIDLAVDDLSHFDPKLERNVVDPGRYELMLGASSSDIRGRAVFDIARP